MARSMPSRSWPVLRTAFETILVDFGAILGVLGEPKWRPKSIFWMFFCDVFFESVLAPFWVHFWRPRTSKSRFSRERGANCHKIGIFEKSSKKASFWVHFGRRGPPKIDETSCSKLSFFFTFCFCVSWRLIVILARFGEAPGAPKINKKSKKLCLGQFWNAFGIQHRFWTRFWTDFGGF